MTTSRKYMDVQKTVAAFGGRKELHRKLSRRQPLSLRTIDKWLQNKSIPAKWLLELATITGADGKRVLLDSFVLPGRYKRVLVQKV